MACVWPLTQVTASQGSEEITEIRYYDWLLNHADCRQRATILLNLMAGDQYNGDLPPARNYYRQGRGTNDCGLVIYHETEP